MLLIALLLTACSGDDNGDDNGASPTAQAAQESAPTATVADATDDDADDATATSAESADDPTSTADASPTTAETTPTTADDTATTPTADSGQQTPDAAGGDRVHQAGDAGDVTLRVEGDRLILVDVQPSDGWTHRVDEDDDDEIEIDFRDNGREIDFEAEIDDGRLKIDVCDTVLDPAGDVYTVGDAGEVEARQVGDDDLELVEVRPNEGWEFEVESDDDDEIEVEFRRGDERLKFDLEEDDGRLEAKTCTRTVTSLAGDQQPASPPIGLTGDNVHQAGDAGEVELQIDGGEIRIADVRPNNGWTHRVEEDDDDEIEIEFRDNGREIDFEAEIDDGRLKIDVCDTVLDPAGDVYTIADAGEVEARVVSDDDLELVEVRPNDGWSYEVDNDDDDEIEVEFRNGDQRLKFDLEYDDDRLEAKTCTRTIVETGTSASPSSTSTGDDHHDDDHHDDDDDD